MTIESQFVKIAQQQMENNFKVVESLLALSCYVQSRDLNFVGTVNMLLFEKAVIIP